MKNSNGNITEIGVCVLSGGGQGAGAQENRGWKGYGRWEGKGGEAGFPKWRKPGEKRKILQYCVTFYNINRTKRREPLRKGGGKRE